MQVPVLEPAAAEGPRKERKEVSEREDPCPAYEFYVGRFQDAGDEDASLFSLDESVETNHQEAFTQFVGEKLTPVGKQPPHPWVAESAEKEGREVPAFVYLYRRSDLERAWQAVAHLLRPN